MSRKFTFPLKKQNSCIENTTKSESIKGGRKIGLQKQYSIDIPNLSRSNDKSHHLNNNQLVLSDCADNNLKSLSIFGIKNQTDRSTTTKFDVRNRDGQKNITYRRDEQVRCLNIFLNHNIRTNADAVNESESEKEFFIPPSKPDIIQCKDGTYDETTDAASRRDQFQGKIIQTVKTPRRPLIRARSAPVRTIDETTKAFQSRRRSKQKKPDKIYHELSEEQIFKSESVETSARKPKSQSKQLNIPPTRTKSVFEGCDVITLVSLFSSESESELEEYVSPRKTDCMTITQPQMLRRCGKSVSFQENDLKVITSSTAEFPPMFRRGSIAPLARIFRDKRPPTAPPGSIYLKSEPRADEEIENSTDLKTTSIQKKKSEEDDAIDDYPDYCNTQKEKDCWKLFKKMVGNGITVNYDTILRGMLTPTELRTVMGKRVELSRENEQIQNLPG